MFYSYPQQTFQEIPDEISIAISISGCQKGCKYCHSTETWNPNFGCELDTSEIDKLIKRFKHSTCFLFYGGEWETETLKTLFSHIKTHYNLKIALYSGEDLSYFDENFPEYSEYLDFIKVGNYQKKLGNLTSKSTNQRLYKINKFTSTNPQLEDITYRFFK